MSRRTHSPLARLRRSLLNRARAFRTDQRGGAAFEAIWAGFFLLLFIAPTVYLYQTSHTHLGAMIEQRTAARNLSLNSLCSSGALNPIPGKYEDGVNSKTLYSCQPGIDGESVLNDEQKFWKKMDKVSDPHFSNFTRDMKDEGKVTLVKGTSTVITTKQFGSQEAGWTGIIGDIVAGNYTEHSALLVPGGDTWVFKDKHWKEGHDDRFCDALPSGSRVLFPNVFPSASKC